MRFCSLFFLTHINESKVFQKKFLVFYGIRKTPASYYQTHTIMNRIKHILFALGFIFSATTFAQTAGEIQGKVFDKNGETLPGALVEARNGTNKYGTGADLDGSYVIKQYCWHGPKFLSTLLLVSGESLRWICISCSPFLRF